MKSFGFLGVFILSSAVASPRKDSACDQAAKGIFRNFGRAIQDARLWNSPEEFEAARKAGDQAAGVLVEKVERACTRGPCDAESIAAMSDEFYRSSIWSRFTALHGRFLRQYPICLQNYVRTMATAVGFQVGGYGMESLRRGNSGKGISEFPVSLFLNSMVLIWVQQEIACRETMLGLNRGAGHLPLSYFEKSWNRYRELLLSIPFVMVSYATLATLEHEFRREMDLYYVGSSIRRPVFSTGYLHELLVQAIFISTFESALFFRSAYLTTPVNLEWLPALQNYLKTRSKSELIPIIQWIHSAVTEVSGGWSIHWWKQLTQDYFTDFLALNPEEEAEILTSTERSLH